MLHLHKDKGMNPRMLACGMCGKATGVVLLGSREFVDVCDECGLAHYGGANRNAYGKKACGRCGHRSSFTRRPIGDHEKIYGDTCDECREFINQEHALARESNAVSVAHRECGFMAIIRGDHPIAIDARKHHPEHDRNRLRVELPKDLCPQCREGATSKEPKQPAR